MTNEQLPVLRVLTELFGGKTELNLKRVAFVSVQHILHTSVNLFQSLIDLGADPKNMFLMGKHYSTCYSVINDFKDLGVYVQPLTPLKKIGDYYNVFLNDLFFMWEHVRRELKHNSCDMIIVLDDGGRCLELIPDDIMKNFDVIGIEQTTAGLHSKFLHNPPIPVIDVAACAVKREIEPDMIASSIIDKFDSHLGISITGKSCGIIGFGAIGKALADKLFDNKSDVFYYDLNVNYEARSIKGIRQCKSIKDLIDKVDYIFGCTGKNVSEDIMDIIDCAESNKYFLSCSSEDKEFRTFLEIIRKQNEEIDPIGHIQYETPSGKCITLISGGFPVNFDDTGTCVPAEKIQLTRGLLLVAVIQAMLMKRALFKGNMKGRVMLHPILQKCVFKSWVINYPNNHVSQELMHLLKENSWIIENSGGVFVENTCLSGYLARIVTSSHLFRDKVDVIAA